MKVSVRDEKDLIHNALETLDSGKKWIKGQPRRGDTFCITGALSYEAGGYSQGGRYGGKFTHESQKLVWDACLLISKSIKKLFPHRPYGVPTFNDCASTSWGDVEAVLKDAMGEGT